jgi:hypothetical protein
MPFTSLCGLVRSCPILSGCWHRFGFAADDSDPWAAQQTQGVSSLAGLQAATAWRVLMRIVWTCSLALVSRVQSSWQIERSHMPSESLARPVHICIPKQFWPVEGSSFTTSSCECRTLPSLHKFTFLVRHLYSLNTWAKHDFTVTKESEKTVAELGAKQLIVEVRR